MSYVAALDGDVVMRFASVRSGFVVTALGSVVLSAQTASIQLAVAACVRLPVCCLVR